MLVDDTLEAALPRARRFINHTRPQTAEESGTRTVAEIGINAQTLLLNNSGARHSARHI